MSAVAIQRGAQTAAVALKTAQTISTEYIGYDFVGLLVKIVFLQVAALLIAKYIEAVIGASNIILSIAKFFGYNIPMFLPQSVVDFYTNGWNGIKYWDIIKLATIAIIAFEMSNYMKAQKRLGGEPSPATMAVFVLFIGFFLIITVPEMIQRIKDANAMLTASTTEGSSAPI